MLATRLVTSPLRSVAHALLSTAVIAGCNCDDGSGLDSLAPSLSIAPASIDFGEVSVGDLRVRKISLENAGGLPLEGVKVTVTAPTGEFVVLTSAPASIAPKEIVEFTLSFEPRDVGPEEATVTVEADDDKPPRVVSLRGIGVASGVLITPNGERCSGVEGSLSFGDGPLGQRVQ